jgi:hypothetical protein
MKPYVEWDEAYILGLPPGEHDWIEFKDTRSLDFSLPSGNENKSLNALSKQVSAFANSGGGVIVYGIKNPTSGMPREIDDIGGVSLSLKNGVKEWLEDAITTIVDPMLARFNVYTLEGGKSGSAIASGRALVIIEIPASESAPHQANDNVYYGRVAGKSRPLSHRFVLDILNRPKHPKMKVTIKLVNKRVDGGAEKEPAFEIFCENAGRVVAEYVCLFITFPASLVEEHNYYFTRVDDAYVQRSFKNLREDIVGWTRMGQHGYEKPNTITRYDPVLPGLGFTRTEELRRTGSVIDLSKHADEYIEWEIYADSAPTVHGKIRVGDLRSIEDDE